MQSACQSLCSDVEDESRGSRESFQEAMAGGRRVTERTAAGSGGGKKRAVWGFRRIW